MNQRVEGRIETRKQCSFRFTGQRGPLRGGDVGAGTCGKCKCLVVEACLRQSAGLSRMCGGAMASEYTAEC